MNLEKKVESLHQRHLELCEKTQGKKTISEKVLAEVRDFTDDCRHAGKDVHKFEDREKLRSFLLYWSEFLPQHSEDPEYRDLSLLPFEGKVVEEQEAVLFWQKVPMWAWGAVVGGAILLVVGGRVFMAIWGEKATPTPTMVRPTTPTATSTSTPTPSPTSMPTATSTPTATPSPPPSACPSADGEGTVPPAVAIYSITFIVNGVEQVVRDFDTLQASPGDQVRVREVAICPVDTVEDNGGKVYVEFDPVDQNGQVLQSEVKGTRAVQVTSGFTPIPGPDYTWTIGDNWRYIHVASVHYPPGSSTQDPNCEGGLCEVDDHLIVNIQ